MKRPNVSKPPWVDHPDWHPEQFEEWYLYAFINAMEGLGISQRKVTPQQVRQVAMEILDVLVFNGWDEKDHPNRFKYYTAGMVKVFTVPVPHYLRRWSIKMLKEAKTIVMEQNPSLTVDTYRDIDAAVVFDGEEIRYTEAMSHQCRRLEGKYPDLYGPSGPRNYWDLYRHA